MKHFYTKGVQILLLIAGGMLLSLKGVAQYTPSVLASGGVYSAVATDMQNRVYVVAYNATSGKYEVDLYPEGSTGAHTTIYSDLAGPGADHPWGIAVNSLGDVYVTNPNTSNNWEVIKLASGTRTPSVILHGNYYTALTTDASNNLLTMEYDASTHNYQVVRYNADGGARTPLYNGIPIAAGDGSYPWGLVMDKQHNIYILDLPNSSANGKVIKLTAPGYAPTTLLSGKNYSSLAIDAAGNLYTSELASGTTYHVMKYAAPALTSGTEIYTGLSTATLLYPWGLAVDGHGNVFVNDPAANSGNGDFIKLTSNPVSVSSVIRASPNPTGAATVDFTVTFSAPVSNVTASAFSITTTGGISGVYTSNVTGSGTTYTVTVNTGTGNGTLQLGVNGINILNNLSNIPYANGEVYTITRATVPTGSFTINGGAALTNNPSVTLDITAQNADEMRFASESGPYGAYEAIAASKSYTLSPGDGLKTVHMQLKDAAGNEPVFDATITLDQTAPNTTIITGPPAVTNVSNATFTFASGETGSTFETSLDGNAYTLTPSPFTITGLPPGPHTLSARAVDPAGNVDPTPDTYSWTIDQTPPAVTSVNVPANGYYKRNDVLVFKVNFNENPLVNVSGGIPYLEVTIGTTTRHAVYTGGSGTGVLTFGYTVQDGDMDMDGIALGTALVLNGGTIGDAAGNNAVTTLQSVGSTAGVFVNTAAPGVTLSTTAPSIVNQSFTVTATFTEAVTGFTVGDMVSINATTSNLQTADNITYTMLVTPGADGAVVSIQVLAGGAVNIGNNGNTASNTLHLTYDGTAPAVTSVDVPANGTYKGSDALSFAVHYAENVSVTGTPSLGVQVGSQTAQATYTGGSGTNVLTFTYTVQDGDADNDGIALNADVALNGGAIKDAAGNNASLPLNNVANTTGVLVDAEAPAVISVNVPANGYYTSGNVLNFTVVLTENTAVSTFGGTPYLDVVIGTTTRHAVYKGGTGTSALYFSYTVQPGDMDMDGIALGTALVPNGGTIRDAAGNDAALPLHGVESTAGVFVNTGVSGVTLSTATASPVNQPFTVTATFTEAVTGFTAGDMAVTNATVSNLQTADNITYTMLVTPAADGAVSVQVPAGAAVNIGNNGNTASNTLSLTYDGTAPAVTSVDVPADGTYNGGKVLSFTVHYSENVTVSGTPSLDVVIGAATQQAVYTGGSGTNALTFSYTVQNGDMDMDGIALGTALALNGGTAKDAAGNNALLTLANAGSTAGVLVNTATPGVAISTAAVSPVNQPFTATITFTEAVTGFTQSDIAVANASLSNFQSSDNITYTVLITPAADGTVSVHIPAGVAMNSGTNDNTASNTLSLTYDGTAPAVTSVNVPADGIYNNGKVLSFTVHYSENVTVSGTPSLDVVIGAATQQAVYTGGSGTNALTFSYTVQNGDMDMDGIALGAAVNGTIRDATGNNALPAINHAGSTAGVLVNTQHPSVVLSSAAASRVNAPVTVTITFSEAVTGFTAADISVSNATAGTLQTADNITYTVVITPVADGSVNVSVPAGAAVNTGTNGNTASNTLSFTYDGTAPVISPQNFEIKGDSPAGTAVGKLSAADAGGALQNWTIATDGSGGAFAIDGSGNITVKDAAILKSKAGTKVSITVTVSDGLNTSAPAQVTVNILSLFVNKAPTLDEIADESNCAGTAAHTIQLTGMSAVEPGQTYTLAVAADQPYFDKLTVTAAGLLTYQLKPDITSGTANITVTIKDNGGTENGGADTRQRTFSITVNSLPAVSISSDKGNNISKGDIIRLTATGGGSYSWAPADGIISGQQSAVLQVRTIANTTYEVTVTNAAGCSNTGSIDITTIADFKVEATNILSPNGDGRNDKWVIRNLDSYPDNEVKIFDRTGRMVYQRRNYSNDWDGTMNGKPLAEGTYYYILTISGNTKTAKGYITIIRAQ